MTPPTYVALLRGINVGGNRRVPMMDLRATFASLGLSDVKTYINSGNVVFRSGTPQDHAGNAIAAAVARPDRAGSHEAQGAPDASESRGASEPTGASEPADGRDTPESHSALAERITCALARDFGFPIEVLILPAATFVRIAEAIPADWANDKSMKCDVIFLFPAFDGPRALRNFDVRPGIDTAIYESGAVLWRVSRQDQPRSGLRSILGTPVYQQCTVRNVNTVRRLAAMLDSK